MMPHSFKVIQMILNTPTINLLIILMKKKEIALYFYEDFHSYHPLSQVICKEDYFGIGTNSHAYYCPFLRGIQCTCHVPRDIRKNREKVVFFIMMNNDLNRGKRFSCGHKSVKSTKKQLYIGYYKNKKYKKKHNQELMYDILHPPHKKKIL